MRCERVTNQLAIARHRDYFLRIINWYCNQYSDPASYYCNLLELLASMSYMWWVTVISLLYCNSEESGLAKKSWKRLTFKKVLQLSSAPCSHEHSPGFPAAFLPRAKPLSETPEAPPIQLWPTPRQDRPYSLPTPALGMKYQTHWNSNSELPQPWQTPPSVTANTSMKRLKNAIK